MKDLQMIGDERFANYWRWLCLMPWTKWWEMQIIGDAATNFFCWHQVQRQTAKNNFDKICFVSYTNTIYTRFCNLYNTVFLFSNIFVNLYNLQFRQLSSASSFQLQTGRSLMLCFLHLYIGIFLKIIYVYPWWTDNRCHKISFLIF